MPTLATRYVGHMVILQRQRYLIYCPCGRSTGAPADYDSWLSTAIIRNLEPGEVKTCQNCGARYWVEDYQQGQVVVEIPGVDKEAK